MIEVIIAQKYINKYHNAKNENIDFNLDFSLFKRLMNIKRCFYTGILMTSKPSGVNIKATDRTVDRIDSSKGYVKGNVVACCHTANKMKGTLESSDFMVGLKGMKKIIKTIENIESK